MYCSKWCCLAAAELSICWKLQSSFYSFGFQNYTTLRRKRELKDSYWDHADRWICTETEPASPWSKLELVSSWALTLWSPDCLTGAMQPQVHAVGDKKDEGKSNRPWVERGWSTVRVLNGGKEASSDTPHRGRLMGQKTSETMQTMEKQRQRQKYKRQGEEAGKVKQSETHKAKKTQRSMYFIMKESPVKWQDCMSHFSTILKKKNNETLWLVAKIHGGEIAINMKVRVGQ